MLKQQMTSEQASDTGYAKNSSRGLDSNYVSTKSSQSVLKSVLEANARHSQQGVRDIVQFSSAEYYCTEGEGFVEIQVDRLGEALGDVSVDFCTKDGSAKAGKKYAAQQGTLIFGTNVTEQRIRIVILEDDSFDSVLEFQVHLKNAQNALIDSYLSKCEITVVDDDTFPTNRHRAEIRAGAIISSSSLLREFFKMNFGVPVIRNACIKTGLTDQLQNLKHIWLIFLSTYMIDTVLRPADGSRPPDNAFFQVCIIILLTLVTHPFEWVLQQLEANRRVAGKVISPIQSNLMRKFLNYSEASRKNVANSDLTMSVTRDVPELVLEGFCMIFPITQQIGLLFMLGAVAVQRSKGTHLWLNIGFFLAYPILMCLFLCIREKGTVRRRHAIFEAQTRLCAFTSKITEFYRLIADYFQKQETVEKFADKVKDCNGAATAFLKWGKTNEQFAPFLTDVICAAFVLSTANDVLDGGAVGEFLTGIAIFRGIGQCYQGIYAHMLTMQQAIAPLQNIVYYMNLPVDLTDRMLAHRQLLEELDKAQQVSQALLYEGKTHNCSLVQNTTMIQSGEIVEKAVYAQDLVQIDCQDLSFSYNLAGGDIKTVLSNTSFEAAQGQLVAVVGPRGSGKSTLLKLVAGVLVPTQGSGLFFMPPHLKVGHVTHNPEIMDDDSIFDNLCFGPSDGEDEDPERILSIMRRMGMSQEVVNAVKSTVYKDRHSVKSLESQATLTREHASDALGKEDGTMSSVVARARQTNRADTESRMSHTDRCLIHIARGFIMNPEVLVMHKPLSHFDRVQAGRILELLREFVDMRGIEKPVEERVLRRPRTCFFSAAAMEGIDYADLVLQVDDCSVQEVKMDEFRNLEMKAHQLFIEMDSDSDGVVTRDEFCAVCRRNGEIAGILDVNPTVLAGKTPEEADEYLGKAFDKLDHTQSGAVKFDELWHFMRHQMHTNMMPTQDNLLAKPGKRLSQKTADLSLLVEPDNQTGLRNGINGSNWDIPDVSTEEPVRRCRVSVGYGNA